MSYSKRHYERQMEEGWRSIGGAVCEDCFTDYAIQKFIRANLTERACSYCSRTSESPIAADMDEVLSFISEGFAREYDIPENCLPYESAEGGWQLVDPYDSGDVFQDLNICTDEGGDLFDDLVSAFSDRQFVDADPLILSKADGLKYSWETFCHLTKHETRFVFFTLKAKSPPDGELVHPDDKWVEYAVPYQILLELDQIVRRHKLLAILPAGAHLIRARQHSASDSYSTASALGSPPKENASQSRMSPAGIPMFYGAADEKTAFIETFDATATNKDAITFGTFEAARPLRLLNLLDLPDIPSIFDEKRYHQRPSLIFVHAFQRDVSAPVNRDGREHYEYVPTQIVAEYFRHIFSDKESQLDGIMFQSSRNRGICYTIFATAEQCGDSVTPDPKHLLRLHSHRKQVINLPEGACLTAPLPLDEARSAEGQNPL